MYTYSGTPPLKSNHAPPEAQIQFEISEKNNPLYKGHLSITARTYFPNGVCYIGVPVYIPCESVLRDAAKSWHFNLKVHHLLAMLSTFS